VRRTGPARTDTQVACDAWDQGPPGKAVLAANFMITVAVAVPGRLDDGVAGGCAGSVRVWIASGLRR